LQNDIPDFLGIFPGVTRGRDFVRELGIHRFAKRDHYHRNDR
jgi:hypothetical protein